MNKLQALTATINAHKASIIKRTAIVGATVIGVTLAAGFIAITPTEKAVKSANNAAKVVKKAAAK